MYLQSFLAFYSAQCCAKKLKDNTVILLELDWYLFFYGHRIKFYTDTLQKKADKSKQQI